MLPGDKGCHAAQELGWRNNPLGRLSPSGQWGRVRVVLTTASQPQRGAHSAGHSHPNQAHKWRRWVCDIAPGFPLAAWAGRRLRRMTGHRTRTQITTARRAGWGERYGMMRYLRSTEMKSIRTLLEMTRAGKSREEQSGHVQRRRPLSTDASATRGAPDTWPRRVAGSGVARFRNLPPPSHARYPRHRSQSLSTPSYPQSWPPYHWRPPWRLNQTSGQSESGCIRNNYHTLYVLSRTIALVFTTMKHDNAVCERCPLHRVTGLT